MDSYLTGSSIVLISSSPKLTQQKKIAFSFIEDVLQTGETYSQDEIITKMFKFTGNT